MQIYREIAAPLIAVLSIVIGAVLNNRLALQRSGAERLRDLRRETYSYIVTKLARALRCCSNINEYLEEDSERFWELHENPTLDTFYECIREAFDKYAEGALVCSREFTLLFEGFDAATEGDPYNDNPDDTYQTYQSALKQFVPLLTTRARREIDPEVSFINRDKLKWAWIRR